MMNEIYFLNVAELAKRLSSKKVSELLAMKHFILFLILYGSAYEFPLLAISSNNYSWTIIIITLITIGLINYYGVKWVYTINCKGDGVDFFKRFSCLSLPVSINSTIVFSFVFFSFYLFMPKPYASTFAEYAMFFLDVGYCIYFYLLMGKSIRVASNCT